MRITISHVIKAKIGNFKPYARRCHYALTKVCSCTPHRMKYLMFIF